jgi:nucleoside-diphosphate-sugar epimerase
MKVLVTGGTGYLGSFLVRRLAEQYGNEAVVCLVPAHGTPAETATREAFQREGIRCVDGDLRSCPVAQDLDGPWDIVLHLAAATDTSLPEEKLAPINVQGTANLLNTLRGQLGGKRVVLTSTSAAVDRPRRPHDALTELSPCKPRTAYGRTKLAAERLLKKWCAAEQAEYTIVRLTTLYGPGVRTGLIPVLAEQLRQRSVAGRVNWPGRVSLLYIEDAVRLILFLAECPEAANDTFFLSSGEAIQVGDLARRLSQLIGTPRQALPIPRWFWALTRRLIWLPGLTRLVPWRLLHILDDGLWCENAKVRRLCAFDLVSLSDGLARTYGPDGSPLSLPQDSLRKA